MKNNPKSFYQVIRNTLFLLQENDLTIFYNDPIYRESREEIRITWPNHVPGGHNCERNFLKIKQYREIINANAFTCLLFDGAMIRVAYSFEDNFLVSHSLLWWPSPFPIDANDQAQSGVLDIFYLNANSKNWHEQIQMRSPVRFDFDVKNAANDHPASHLHMQSGECRLFVDIPVCFNRFIKFIFRNFYPDKYKQHFFWDDLENCCLHFDIAGEPMHPKYEYFTLG